jgi:hypothetical protein
MKAGGELRLTVATAAIKHGDGYAIFDERAEQHLVAVAKVFS